MDCSACVAVEAQLHGCVPVTSTVGGVPELLVHGRTGFAFPLECYQENALAAVAGLVGNMDGFNAIRRAAHSHVVKSLTWDVIARKILDRLSKDVHGIQE
jgi:glycosyltransferase involved in cell wall biosynthesis